MKTGYLKYYERYRAQASLVFTFNALLTRSKNRRLALLNRQRDYLGLSEHLSLLPLHHELNQQLLQAVQTWNSYDYGEGYFYQSCDLIGVTGFRHTRARVEAMKLKERLAGCSVLEIGCNTGFLAVTVADAVRHITGFDVNPHLIEIAQATARHLAVENADFQVSAFEEFATNQAFDVVLSFANHSTYDGNTQQNLERYFERCRQLTAPGGLLLFESHPPQLEGPQLEHVVHLIGEMFEIEEKEVLDYGSFLDRDRTFLVARRHD